MKLELLFTRIYENFPCSPLLLIFAVVLSCGGQAWGQGEFSDGFDRVANSGPYRDWKSIAEANESWAQARACVSQGVDDSSATIVAHDHPDSSAAMAEGLRKELGRSSSYCNDWIPVHAGVPGEPILLDTGSHASRIDFNQSK